MNKSETIKQAFNLLESEYGIQTDHKKEVWATILKDYPAEKIMEATIGYIKTKAFFPFVSDIIKLIERDRMGEAEKTWHDLVKDIFNIGYYGTPSKWSRNKIVNEVVIILGGWQKLCRLREEEEKWTKKEFLKLYEAKIPNNIIEGTHHNEIEELGKISKSIINPL